MIIGISSIIKSGIVLGIQWFNPDEENQTYEIIIDLVLIRITLLWR
jgi:hypothetical protein